MTEAEAKAKWCPFSRVGVTSSAGGGFSANRSGPSVPLREHDRCLGSGCMAWRWDSDFNILIDKHKDKTPVEIREHLADGRCGLAGAQ